MATELFSEEELALELVDGTDLDRWEEVLSTVSIRRVLDALSRAESEWFKVGCSRAVAVFRAVARVGLTVDTVQVDHGSRELADRVHRMAESGVLRFGDELNMTDFAVLALSCDLQPRDLRRWLDWSRVWEAAVHEGAGSDMENRICAQVAAAMVLRRNDVMPTSEVVSRSELWRMMCVGERIMLRRPRDVNTENEHRRSLGMSGESSEDIHSLEDDAICDKLRLTTTQKIALNALEEFVASRAPVIISGGPSSGKSTILKKLAILTKNVGPREPIQVSLEGAVKVGFDAFCELVGGLVPAGEGSFSWKLGPIGTAITQGRWLVFDGVSESTPRDVLVAVQRISQLKVGFNYCPPGASASANPLRTRRGFNVFLCTRDRSNLMIFFNFGWKFIDVGPMSTSDLRMLSLNRFHLVSDCVERVLCALTHCEKILAPFPYESDSRKFGISEVFKVLNRLSTLSRRGTLTAITGAQECLDIFCGFVVTPELKNELTHVVSSAWSIAADDLLYIQKSGKPKLETDAKGEMRLGRATLSTPPGQVGLPQLALNKHTLRYLEIIARALEENEPLLLCGETGVGKTTIVQNLSSAVGSRLSVVNLSRESDPSILLGTFHPVDIQRELVALGREFENAFGLTVSKDKNLDFLDALRCSVRRMQLDTALKLMEGACRSLGEAKRNRTSDSAHKWSRVMSRMNNLKKTVGNSSSRVGQKKRKRSTSNRQFCFREGPLLTAMREGMWILLDEINLAPSETLEVLSLLLWERKLYIADTGETVYASPSFRLIAAMNPPTDAGKKPLPDDLRRSFTEIYVDEPSCPEDIAELCFYRFCLRGILSSADVKDGVASEEGVLKDTAKFYLEVKGSKALARGDESTPVFNLRSLSRMLDYAASMIINMKTSKGSTRRCLHEGALLAIGSSLADESRAKIEQLSRMMIMKGSEIHRPNFLSNGEFIEVAGFPVRVGEEARPEGALWDQGDDQFLVTDTFREVLRKMARAMCIRSGSFPLLLQGPTSAGKTSVVSYFGRITGNRLIRINNHEQTDTAEYLGFYTAASDGSLQFHDGPLVTAARNGYWVVLDELNLAPPEVLECLNRLLDDNREIYVPETGETVKAHSRFALFATQNPPLLYGGRKLLSRAFRSRFVEIFLGDLNRPDLAEILNRQYRMPNVFWNPMLDVFFELQRRRAVSDVLSGARGFVTPRDLFRWALRHPDSREMLARQGFFLLGERARDKEDRNFVRTTLIRYIKVEEGCLDDDQLYGDVSCSSKDRISFSGGFISQTPSMRRIMKLVCEATQFSEPILLVGDTGCGKTSAIQCFSEQAGRRLRTINCHRGTESSDFIGSYRAKSQDGRTSFMWTNGPLVASMIEGEHILIDELNMADEAVSERLNSVLEPGRTIALTEKGTSKGDTVEVIRADDNFRLFATMNPSGDHGKKELSPAMRNRFTEVWIPAPEDPEEFFQVALSRNPSLPPICDKIAEICCQLRRSNQVSLRDAACWSEFVSNALKYGLTVNDAFFEGGMMILTSIRDEKRISYSAFSDSVDLLKHHYQDSISVVKFELTREEVRIGPLRLPRVDNGTPHPIPTYNFTSSNSMDLFGKIGRALVLDRPILLEGPPGVGKTASVEALAFVLGVRLYRLNLSEHTEMSDLVGSDFPGARKGEFEFIEGPLLEAMKTGGWILLDELNLANQSVLEGLNSVLDHRRSVFVPELSELRVALDGFRVFGTQNPATSGAGRKMLPSSFLNRFIIVAIGELTSNDLSAILGTRFPSLSPLLVSFVVEGVQQLQRIEGLRPNLRDALRVCRILNELKHVHPIRAFELTLVHRNGGSIGEEAITGLCCIYTRVFGPNAVPYTQDSRDSMLALYLSDEYVRFGQTVPSLIRGRYPLAWSGTSRSGILRFSEQLSLAIHFSWPVIIRERLEGEASQLIYQFGTLAGRQVIEFDLGASSDVYDLLGSYEIRTLETVRHDATEVIEGHLCDVVAEFLRGKHLVELRHLESCYREFLTCALSESHRWCEILHELIKSLQAAGCQLPSELLELVDEAAERLLSKTPAFRWKKSKLVRALERGQWVHLRGAHLCPAAVLDRLNPLLEGNCAPMLVSEAPRTGDETLNLVRMSDQSRIIISTDLQPNSISDAIWNRSLVVDVIDCDSPIFSLRSAQTCPSGLCVFTELAGGSRSSPSKEIISTSLAATADLIVLGSHPRDASIRLERSRDLMVVPDFAPHQVTIRRLPWEELKETLGHFRGSDELEVFFPGLFDSSGSVEGWNRYFRCILASRRDQSQFKATDTAVVALLTTLGSLWENSEETLILIIDGLLQASENSEAPQALLVDFIPKLESLVVEATRLCSNMKPNPAIRTLPTLLHQSLNSILNLLRPQYHLFWSVLFPSPRSKTCRQLLWEHAPKLNRMCDPVIADVISASCCRALPMNISEELLGSLLRQATSADEKNSVSTNILRSVGLRASWVFLSHQIQGTQPPWTSFGRHLSSGLLKVGNMFHLASSLLRLDWVGTSEDCALKLGAQVDALIELLRLSATLPGRYQESSSSAKITIGNLEDLSLETSREMYFRLCLGSSSLTQVDLVRVNGSYELCQKLLFPWFMKASDQVPQLSVWMKHLEHPPTESFGYIGLGKATFELWKYLTAEDPMVRLKSEIEELETAQDVLRREVEALETWGRRRIALPGVSPLLKHKQNLQSWYASIWGLVSSHLLDRECGGGNYRSTWHSINGFCERIFDSLMSHSEVENESVPYEQEREASNQPDQVPNITKVSCATRDSLQSLSSKFSIGGEYDEYRDVHYLAQLGIELARTGVQIHIHAQMTSDTSDDGKFVTTEAVSTASTKLRPLTFLRAFVYYLQSGQASYMLQLMNRALKDMLSHWNISERARMDIEERKAEQVVWMRGVEVDADEENVTEPVSEYTKRNDAILAKVWSAFDNFNDPRHQNLWFWITYVEKQGKGSPALGCVLDLEAIFHAYQSSKKTYTNLGRGEIHRLSEALNTLLSRIRNIESSFLGGESHPVLEGVGQRARQILNLDSDEPITMLIGVIQALIDHSEVWDKRYGPKEWKLNDETSRLVALVADLRKKESESWSNVLEDRLDHYKSKVPEWFARMLYFVAFSDLEENEILETVDHFLRSANLGDFSSRLSIVDRIVNYIRGTNFKLSLARTLEAVRLYYDQFRENIDLQLRAGLTDIHGKLQDLLKLTSWKDQSSVEEVDIPDMNSLDIERLRILGENRKRKFHGVLRSVDSVAQQGLSDMILKEMKREISFDDGMNRLPLEFVFTENLFHDQPRLIPRVQRIVRKIRTRFPSVFVRSATGSASQALIAVTGAVRARIKSLSQRSDASLSEKQRAIADLLRHLGSCGILQSATSDPLDKRNWLTTGSVSSSWSGARRFHQSSLEMMDSTFFRISFLIKRFASSSLSRHPDVSPNQLKAMRGYSFHLYDMLTIERSVMVDLAHDFKRLGKTATRLMNLRPVPSNISLELFPQVARAAQIISTMKVSLLDVKLFIEALSEASKTTLSSTLGKDEFPEPIRRDLDEKVKKSKETLTEVEALIDRSISAVPPLNLQLPGLEDMLSIKVAEDRLQDILTFCDQVSCSGPEGILELHNAPVAADVCRHLAKNLRSMTDRTWLNHQFISKQSSYSDLTHSGDQLIDCVMLTVQRSSQSIRQVTLDESSSLDGKWMKLEHDFIQTLPELISLSKLDRLSQEFSEHVEQLQSRGEVDSDSEQLILSVGYLLDRLLECVATPLVTQFMAYHERLCSFTKLVVSIFCTISEKGFCKPPNHAESDDQGGGGQEGGGPGLGDAEGEDLSGAVNLSDEIEEKEQLEGLRDDERRNQEPEQEAPDDENGVELDDDFGGALGEKDQENEDSSHQSEAEDRDETMGDAGDGTGWNEIDEKFWDDSEGGDVPEEDVNDAEEHCAKGLELGARESDSEQADPEHGSSMERETPPLDGDEEASMEPEVDEIGGDDNTMELGNDDMPDDNKNEANMEIESMSEDDGNENLDDDTMVGSDIDNPDGSESGLEKEDEHHPEDNSDQPIDRAEDAATPNGAMDQRPFGFGPGNESVLDETHGETMNKEQEGESYTADDPNPIGPVQRSDKEQNQPHRTLSQPELEDTGDGAPWNPYQSSQEQVEERLGSLLKKMVRIQNENMQELSFLNDTVVPSETEDTRSVMGYISQPQNSQRKNDSTVELDAPSGGITAMSLNELTESVPEEVPQASLTDIDQEDTKPALDKRTEIEDHPPGELNEARELIHVMDMDSGESGEGYTGDEGIIHGRENSSVLSSDWASICRKTAKEVTSLSQRLHAILEPTGRTRLGGSFKSGKRLNMRRVIEFVASDYRKDRIWMRRQRPDKREYAVLLAIDNSESMSISGAGRVAIEALTVIQGALSLVGVGRVAVLKFGEHSNLVHSFRDPPIASESGNKLLQSFSFRERTTDVAQALEGAILAFEEARQDGIQGAEENDNFLLMLSDGMVDDREAVKHLVRQARERRILIVLIVIDQPSSSQVDPTPSLSLHKSIFDIKRATYVDGKMKITSYLEDYPFPFYVVVQTLAALPHVVGDALSQWMERTRLENYC